MNHQEQIERYFNNGPTETKQQKLGRLYIEIQIPLIETLLEVGVILSDQDYIDKGYAKQFEQFMWNLKAPGLTEQALEKLTHEVKVIANKIKDVFTRENN